LAVTTLQRETEGTCLNAEYHGRDARNRVSLSDADNQNLWVGEETRVFLVERAALGDLEAGDWGALLTSKSSGSEHVVFSLLLMPEMGRGQQEWDMGESSFLTWGKFVEIQNTDTGRIVKLNYVRETSSLQHGYDSLQEEFFVPHGVPVVNISDADREAISSDTDATIFAYKNSCDCEWEIYRIFLGVDGVRPPL